MGLLLVTAALLGLSNAHAKGVKTNGRVVIGETGGKNGKAGSWPGTGTGMAQVEGSGGKGKGRMNTWPFARHSQGTNGVVVTNGADQPEGRHGALGIRPVDNWHGGSTSDADGWAETGQAGSNARPGGDSGDYA